MNRLGNQKKVPDFEPSRDKRNDDKAKVIRGWIDPEERVTVDFLDEKGLNAEVTGCSKNVVEVLVDTSTPHMRQTLFLPLRLVQVGEDPTHYTRDPDRPLVQGRLRLSVDLPRPPVIY